MGFLGIIVPEAGRNKVLNPIAGAAGNFGAQGSATVTRDQTQVYRGNQSFKIVTTASSADGFTVTTEALTNAIHNVTVYLYSGPATIQASCDNTNWNSMTVVGGKTGGWVRYRAEIPAAQCNTSTTLRFRSGVASVLTFYAGHVQIEATSGYWTTAMDGDMPGLYAWVGLRHGSASTRDSQERGGGRERDLAADYGVYEMLGSAGLGLYPVQNNYLATPLLPGAQYQGYKALPREITLDLALNTSGTTWPALHQARQALIDLIKPNRVRGAQPFVLRYTGTDASGNPTSPMYARFVYAGGLEFNGGNVTGFMEAAGVRLTAADPHWYADNPGTAAVTVAQSITTNYVLARINGLWQTLGTGLSSSANSILYDKQRNRFYFGGSFTTANGVTVNGFTYWNGTTFVAVGGATKGVSGGAVINMALAPNGDVWIVGTFTAAGGSATNKVARYNVAADTFTVYNLGGTGAWGQAAVDTNGLVYLGGSMTSWNGDATQSYVTSYNGSTWAALGTQPYGASEYPSAVAPGCSFAIDKNNYLVIGSSTTGAGSATLRRWNGSAWSLLGSTDAGTKDIKAVSVLPNNNYLIGGTFTTIGGVTATNIAVYNQSIFSAISTGLSGGSVYYITSGQSGLAAITGAFTSVSSSYLAYWNGSNFIVPDAIIGSTPYGVAVDKNDNIYISPIASTSQTTAAQTTATNAGTADVFPKLTLTGPTSTTATLAWLENQTTAERLYFNLAIQPGETVTLDFSAKTVTSDWRGALTNQPLYGSDWNSFHLQPGANVIACYCSGTTTGLTALLTWPAVHNAVDGGA